MNTAQKLVLAYVAVVIVIDIILIAMYPLEATLALITIVAVKAKAN